MSSEKLIPGQKQSDVLSEEQKARVRAALYAEPEALLAEFSRLQTTDELHYFAANSSWYNSSKILLLLQIIRNPLCDRGTALMIYWRSDVISLYRRYARRNEILEFWGDFGDESDNLLSYDCISYDCIKEIEARFAANFYERQTIFFDPAPGFHNRELMLQAQAFLKQRTPKILQEPTFGRVLEPLVF